MEHGEIQQAADSRQQDDTGTRGKGETGKKTTEDREQRAENN
jgi:hypothetical protein